MKHWRSSLYLIPETHAPGKQKGFMGGSKHRKNIGTEHSSHSRGQVTYWQVGRWFLGDIYTNRKDAKK